MQEPHSELASTLPSSASLSSVPPSRSPSPPTLASNPQPHGLFSALRRRARRSSIASAPSRSLAQDSNEMFSARKYTPLPTSSNGGHRKRAGGGITAWKRYIILATLAGVLVVTGYTMLGGRSRDAAYGEDNTYTPNLQESPDSIVSDHKDEETHRLPIDTHHDLPVDTHHDSAVNTPAAGDQSTGKTSSDKTPGTGKGDFEDVTGDSKSEPSHATSDEEDEELIEAVPATKNHPTNFENDPNAAGTTYCTKPTEGKPLVQYALTIDAGSTGSRIHVYKFHNCGPSPQLEYETFKMLQPGLSSFANNPTGAAQSLDPLLEEANRVVPASLQKCTPVEVKATAGLRLLDEKLPGQSAEILGAVRKHLETNYPYTVSGDRAVEVMEGKDEGVYAWITANYLLGKIGEGVKTDDTLAVMDLGGASTQMVFAPKFTDDKEMAEGDHKYSLKFGGRDYTLYQHSYLGYGLMRARSSVHNLVAFTWSIAQPAINWDELAADTTVPNPCLSRGTTRPVTLDPPGRTKVNVTMSGVNGGYESCKRVVELVMGKDALCNVQPCSFRGVYQPSIIDTFPVGDFLALSYFTDRIQPLMPTTKTKLTMSELTSIARDVCDGPTAWEKRWGKDKKAMAELQDRPEYCLDLTFMNGLLGLGYEIKEDRNLLVAKQLSGVELGWALGAGLALVEKADLKCMI